MRSNKDVRIEAQDDRTFPQTNLPHYPIRPNRYNTLGWNQNYQDCYTQEDIALIERIKSEFDTFPEKTKPAYFDTVNEKHWHDWWVCTKPSYNAMLQQLESESFTLPMRESKDSKAFPLWSYADTMARQIANWQADRAKNQKLRLMNDPVMLVFEELKNWFFNSLSEKECKREVLEDIAKRQSYIKSLVHLVPAFGPDKLHFHEIQQSLENASRMVASCVANKELPQLLSDVINTGKSLETMINTILHFLNINEEVAPNPSSCLDENQDNCSSSPVGKIYQSARKICNSDSENQVLKRYQKLNYFYDLITISNEQNVLQVKMSLKKDLASTVNFASFITENEKQKHIEAIAMLESLSNVRKILADFQNIQSKIGTYIFAINYLEKANALAENYINLVNKSKLLIKDLIKSKDNGLAFILRNPQYNSDKNNFFQKNLRALETRVAQGTTVTTQLESYCMSAVESMNKYQHEIKKLVASVHSGEASRELEQAMRELFLQMHDLNTFLPAILGDPTLTINDHSDIKQTDIKQISDSSSVDSPHCELISQENDAVANKIEFNAGKWDIEINVNDRSPVFVYHFLNGSSEVGSIKFNGELVETKTDPVTHSPIFTYLFRQGKTEIGSIEFYGQPIFCLSKDGSRHNIIKSTGFLSELQVAERIDTDEVCLTLPPLPLSLLERVASSASHAAIHGVLRGGTRVMDTTLQSVGVSKPVSYMASQITFYGFIFTMKYNMYRNQSDDNNTAAAKAAYDAGQLLLANVLFNVAANVIDKVGNSLEKNNWKLLGKGVKRCGSMARFGYFAYNAAESPAETSVALVSGAATEILTQKAGNFFIKKFQQ